MEEEPHADGNVDKRHIKTSVRFVDIGGYKLLQATYLHAGMYMMQWMT